METGLLYFIGLQFISGVSPSGMSLRLSALAFWFQFKNMWDITKSFLVRRAMRGFRKGHTVRDSRRPVSYELLLSLGNGLDGVCSDGYEIQLFRTAFSLAFFGAFRISELVSPSRVRARGLSVADVKASAEEVVCVTRRSKDGSGR